MHGRREMQCPSVLKCSASDCCGSCSTTCSLPSPKRICTTFELQGGVMTRIVPLYSTSEHGSAADASRMRVPARKDNAMSGVLGRYTNNASLSLVFSPILVRLLCIGPSSSLPSSCIPMVAGTRASSTISVTMRSPHLNASYKGFVLPLKVTKVASLVLVLLSIIRFDLILLGFTLYSSVVARYRIFALIRPSLTLSRLIEHD